MRPGLSGIFYGLDVVQEFQVVTSGGQAELGRALGGYINVVTKSGTNALHGDLYGYFRNQRFNAANPLSNTKLPLTQTQYGASLGGPVMQDRTFYFANFEQRALNQSGLITIAPANVAAINARLSRSRLPGRADRHRPLSRIRCTIPTSSARWITRFSKQRPVQRALQPVRRAQQQLARRRRAERGDGLGRPGQHGPDRRGEQRRDALRAHGQRDARAVHVQQSERLPTDPIGPAVSISGRRVFRHACPGRRPAG